MRLRKYLIVAASIFIVMIFWHRNVAAYEMAEYFPLNEGDEWTYSSTVTVISYGEGVQSYPVRPKLVVAGPALVDGVETIKRETWVRGSPIGEFDCYVMDSEGLKQYRRFRTDTTSDVILDPPLILFPAQFNVGDVHQGTISYTVYSTEDGTLTTTGTGSNTTSLKSVEDVTVQGGNFKDCLRIYSSITSQTSDGRTFAENRTAWYAHNVGWVKVIRNQSVRHPEIEGYEVTVVSELVSATVGGVQYGCPATLALGGDSNDLNTLRRFRDEVLSKTPTGQEIIRLYYEWSPVIVNAMAKDEAFKEEVKGIIEGVLPLVR